MTLICLNGPSGSGKTTLANAMETYGNVPTICSYTTRPMRPNETQGVEHRFIPNDAAAKILTERRPLAYTKFGGYHYFALWDQLHLGMPEYDLMTYVIDEVGLLGLMSEVDEYRDRIRFDYRLPLPADIQVLPIYIDRPEEQRLADTDADRLKRDDDRIDIDPSLFKVRIQNDAKDHASLIAWSKDFADAIRAYLTCKPAFSMPPAAHCIYTSQPGVANIIAAINDALHK